MSPSQNQSLYLLTYFMPLSNGLFCWEWEWWWCFKFPHIEKLGAFINQFTTMKKQWSIIWLHVILIMICLCVFFLHEFDYFCVSFPFSWCSYTVWELSEKLLTGSHGSFILSSLHYLLVLRAMVHLQEKSSCFGYAYASHIMRIKATHKI